MSRNGETIFGGVVVLAAIGLFVISGDIQDFTNSNIDAAFLPRIAAGLLLVLGLVTILSGRRMSTEEVSELTVEQQQAPSGLPYVLASIGLLLLYVALLDDVGFVICSIVYVFVQVILLTKQETKRWIVFSVVSLVVPVVIYLLFVNVFEVMVPAGLLG